MNARPHRIRLSSLALRAVVAAATLISARSSARAQTAALEDPGSPGASAELRYVRPVTPESLFLTGSFPNASRAGLLWPFRERRAGRALDLTLRRPAVRLDGTAFERLYGRPDAYLIGNFFHRGRHWIARVPRQGVHAAIVQRSYFPPAIPLLNRYFAAHALIRFEMRADRPVEIVAEMPTAERLASGEYASDAAGSEPLMVVRNVALSGEAQWTADDEGRTYSLGRGVLDAFVDVFRFVSVEERLVDFFRSGHPVDQILMAGYSDTDLDRALRFGLEASEADGLSRVYHTLCANCTTRAFDVLERGLGAVDGRFGFIRSFFQRRIPTILGARAVAMGGVPFAPAHLDESLRDELASALERARRMGSVPSRALPAPNRRRIEQAIETARGSSALAALTRGADDAFGLDPAVGRGCPFFGRGP